MKIKVDGFFMEEDGRRKVDLLSLESQIMAVWQTADDLSLVVKNFDLLSMDQATNLLIGVEELHRLRIESLWEVFDHASYNYFMEEKESSGE